VFINSGHSVLFLRFYKELSIGPTIQRSMNVYLSQLQIETNDVDFSIVLSVLVFLFVSVFLLLFFNLSF